MKYAFILVCVAMGSACGYAGGLIVVEQIVDAGADATVDDCDAGATAPNLDKEEPAMLSGCGGGSMTAPLPTMAAPPQSP